MARLAGFPNPKIFTLVLLLALIVSACNLTTAPEQQLQLTQLPSNTPSTTQTGTTIGGLPTTVPVTALVVPTTQGNQFPPTSISLPPVFGFFPTSTPTPISIVILSPIPGNVVAGNIQVLGAAIHPQFLQYQLEYGPDPNPGNLWFPATGIVQTPVLNGLLGIWNTSVVQDSTYQLRLRVTLRDGSYLATVVNNIRVQNQAPTPVPSNTPNVPRPIAAFTQDRATGLAPLVVRFTNQSSGTISNYSWSFGDGGSSPQPNPTYTYRNPGLYTVTLYVSGPSGTSNVSRQINVQSPTTPIAGFTQDKTSGPSPLTINFTNQSTGTISSYAWIFGDGATSTDQNPSHQFVAVGTYNVILTVTGPGGTSSVTRKITVEDPVIPAPVAAFMSDKTSGDAPLLVQFANQSTGQVTNYAWDFGDKQTSAETNPTHIFTDAGTYTVMLTAIGPGGQKTAQATITVNKPPAAPTAAFTQDKVSGDAPLLVQFTDQSQGDITTYAWDFGDGNTNSDKNPAHTFNAAGTYTVKLTVSGPGGSNSTEVAVNATQPIAVPDAAFTQDVSSGTVPFSIQFTNQSTGENLTYLWDFGDGSATSSDMSPQHTYNNAGNYTVTLTVSNSSGTNTAQTSITANAAPPPAAKPVASFVPSATSGDAPLTVTFNSSSSTGDITGYSWSFGDNVGVSTDANPTYVYNTPGSYVVSLTVSGPGGNSDPVTATITVNTPPPIAVKPVASFVPSATNGDAPLNVTFDSSSSSGDITGYSWTFGDNVGVSTDPNPTYVYNTPGSYVVSLTVSGPGGNSDPVTATITVNTPPPIAVKPVASFVPSATNGDAPLNVTFDSSSSTGDITGYSWTFGDNVGVSTDPNPSYAYITEGTYIVTLVVSGPGGNSDPAAATITVNPAPPVAVKPVASFVPSTTNGDAPLTVTFDSSSSTGDITGYSWNFGDSVGVSIDANPAYAYNTPGSYIVSLTVSGPGGSSDPVTATITVNSAPAPLPPITSPVIFVSNRDGNNELYLLQTDGSLTNLSNNGANDNSPAWSPDGTRIAFVSDRDNGNNDIFVMNADGSNPVNLTNNPASDTNPTWSSDSAQLAFVTDRDGNNEVYVMNVNDPSTLVNLSNNGANDNSPAWSPDGTRIAFVSDRDNGNNDIFVMNADGSNPVNLTNNPASDTNPTWSSDSAQLAFVTDRDGNNEVYVMNVNDPSTLVNLSNNGANDNSPAWSANGSQIAFVSDRDNGNNDIFVMNADGSNSVNLTNNPANDINPHWKP